MSSPERTSSQRSSSNLSWAEHDSKELSGENTLAAAVASVRNTQRNLDRIFGPVVSAILDSDNEVDHHEAETTIVSGHFPRNQFTQPPRARRNIHNHTLQHRISLRNTEPPPHQSADMQYNAHTDSWASRADMEEARLQLEEAKIVSQAITAATSKIKEDRLLAADGSNFTQWTRDLQELGRTYLNAAEFFEKPNQNSVLEKIGRAILLASVHSSLVYDVQQVQTSVYDMFVLLRKKFTTISRAAQMNVWNKFMTFRLVDHPSSAGLASKLRDLATEWKALKVNLDEDAFLAFVLQASVTPNSVLSLDFERRVELKVQQDSENKPPGFDRMIHLLEICRQQEEFLNGKNKSATSSLQQQPSLVLEATAGSTPQLPPFDQQAFLVGVPEDQWDEALQFYEVTANQCYACGKDNHYMRDCPTRARGIPLNRRQRGPGNFSLRPAMQRYQQPPSTPFYPIVGAMYPPPGLPFPQQFQYQPAPQLPYSPSQYNHQLQQQSNQQAGPGMLPQHQQLRRADNYQPNYSNNQQKSYASSNSTTTRSVGGASARQLEVDNLVDGLSSVDFQSMEASFTDVSSSAIVDSGASHNLTGNFSCLHNFRHLKNPIPLNVATRGSGAFISGVGELRFRGPSGRIITLTKVFYNSFEIFNRNKSHLFSCVLDRARNRWCLPFPMLP
ncbi:hypothetical protein PCANC_03596 [Puccinia coronata f. sp. avenae]|uniref:CCHC-type domain-containing protein n=1 Tax=Puccinia coronata f. sp. avenae TaxID=200324 RepID=A0A2N5VUV7_9BASI|nr:hypothetical protein PCANC_03596 [Puccinia coronata f. sp. avenae]